MNGTILSLTESAAPQTSALPSPVRYASALAVVYVVFGSLYIVVSTRIAASVSLSVDQMQTFETWKGIGFIGVTAALLFFSAFFTMRRSRRQEDLIMRQSQALMNSEKVLLASTFAGAVAHDINNALTVSFGAAAEIRRALGRSPESEELVADLERSLENIAEWNRRLLDLGVRRTVGERTDLDLAEVVSSAVHLAKRHANLRKRDVAIDAPGRIPLLGSEQLIRRAVLNLVLNAAEACPEKGHIRVAVDSPNLREARIRVDDDGPGVPEDLRRRVLEPFFTTKAEGTGMGLASVSACAEAHGGKVTVGESPLGGARFEISLKRETAAAIA